MKYKKLVITLLLAVFLMIQIVNSEDWYRYGSDHMKSFVYDSDYRGNFISSSDTVKSSLYTDKTSLYSPLVADLDGDGLREIIVVKNNEIRLFRGNNYSLIDTYFNSNLNPIGQMEVVDFISGGNKELVLITNTSTNYSLWAINWDGTDFNISKEIVNMEPSNGLNCYDLYGDSSIECIYFGHNGGLYSYSEDDSSAKSPVLNLGDDDCVDYSIPVLLDYDEDNDEDIFVIWNYGRSCGNVIKIRNNNDGSFTYQYNYTSGGIRVNQIAMVDLDGGQKELVISSGVYSTKRTDESHWNDPMNPSAIYVYEIINNVDPYLCDYGGFGYHNRYHAFDYWSLQPYITGLHTCYGQEGTLVCDYDSDSYDEIYVVSIGDFYTGYYGSGHTLSLNKGKIYVLDYDCSVLSSVEIGQLTYIQTIGKIKGVWANLDEDTEFEFLWEGIIDKNGSYQFKLDDIDGDAYTYQLIAEVTGDTTNEIIIQKDSSDIRVYSSTIPADCIDSDGADFFTKGNVTYPGGIIYDFCVGDGVVEKICPLVIGGPFDGQPDEILKDCKDYGENYSCIDGKCFYGIEPVISNVYSYRNESSYPYYNHHTWYTPNDRIWWYVNATETFFTAVDCDISGPPYVSDWGTEPSNLTSHYNCTYASNGDYTAKIYVTTDGNWDDYSNYVYDIVYIRDCVTYHDCDSGYECNTGTGMCYLPSNVTNCTDTDSGIDYEVKGTVTTLWENVTDYCHSATSVNEYWCDSGQPSGYSYTWYNCQNIDSSYTCYEGRCQNVTPTAYTSLYVKDFDTSAGLSGIKYTFVQYPSYTVVAEGYTPSGGLVTLNLELGYDYQLSLDDDGIWTYKDWLEKRFVLTGTINAYMEQHCSPDCLFLETFSYADSIYHHGWGGGNYTTYYHPDYGFMLDIDTGISIQDINIKFPEPTKNVQEIKYSIIMTDQTPSENQRLDVYLEDISDNDIFIMRYDVDDVDTVHVYYFDTSWHEISFVQLPQPTIPMTTTLYYDEANGKIDIYFDVLSDGNNILYVEDNSVINSNILQQIRLDPDTSTYSRNIYVDYVDISQQSVAPDEEEEGSVTRPSGSDLETPWYRDAEGELHFDASKCEGWKSYLMCAGWKQGVSYVATGVSWIFSGVHILYFVVMLLIIIIIGPLLVEFFKPKH